MSYSLDVNLLLYASDTTSPFHRRAREFLSDCSARPELLFLAWPTVTAYLRISTHSSVFASPLTPRDAAANIDSLVELPHVRLISELDGFWEVYGRITADLAIRGNLVPDAHIAVLLFQHGVARIYSNDADFRRFPFLDVRNPLE